jgi:AcrR family transcriptional regulator
MQVPVKTSPHRAEQATLTRRRIVQAARDVFEREGYAGARIEDIAREAGVAVPTVYKTFANKRNVLASAVTAAMTGGEVAAIERETWWLEQLDAPTADEQLRLIARNARRINQRAGKLLEIVRAAAASDAEMNALWQDINRERIKRSRTSAKRLASKAQLRMAVPDTARTLWTLTAPELYGLQIRIGGFKPARYEHWLADLLVAAVLQP